MRPLPLALVLSLGLVSSAARADEPTPTPPAASEAHGAFEPGTPPLADLLAKAKAAGKPVFLDVFTTWCGPCKMLERDAFPKEEVVAALKAFVCARYDAEKGEGVAVAKRYEVQGYPTMLVIDADGQEIDRIVGYGGVKPLVNEVDRIARGEGTLPALRKALEANPDDFPSAVKLAGREMLSDPAAAAKRLEDVLQRAHGKDKESEAAALLGLAAGARRTRSFEDASARLETLLKDFAETNAAGDAAGELRGVLMKLPAVKAFALLELARAAARDPEAVAQAEQLAYLWHQNESAGAIKKWAAASAANGQALNEVAWTAFVQKVAPDAALGWAKKAVELTAREPAVLDTLANLQFAAGKVDEAIQLEEEALKNAEEPTMVLEFTVNVAMWKAAREAKKQLATREKPADAPSPGAPDTSR